MTASTQILAMHSSTRSLSMCCGTNNYGLAIKIFNIYMVLTKPSSSPDASYRRHLLRYTLGRFGATQDTEAAIPRTSMAQRSRRIDMPGRRNIQSKGSRKPSSNSHRRTLPQLQETHGMAHTSRLIRSLPHRYMGPDPSGFLHNSSCGFDITNTTTYEPYLPSSAGNISIPQLGGKLMLTGRDSKIHVTYYDAGGINFAYCTAEISTWDRNVSGKKN
ncbi:beta-galactosidase, domain 2-domain-containing protein [Hypoxylon sp. NC1633]|nr:beta-galactosidase, domain 2-domain-containing protein [Hypoxylon sp. NC1633]